MAVRSRARCRAGSRASLRRRSQQQRRRPASRATTAPLPRPPRPSSAPRPRARPRRPDAARMPRITAAISKPSRSRTTAGPRRAQFTFSRRRRGIVATSCVIPGENLESIYFCLGFRTIGFAEKFLARMAMA